MAVFASDLLRAPVILSRIAHPTEYCIPYSAASPIPQNIVGSCDVKFPIRLEGIMYKHSLYSSVRANPII
jgi:TATA-box binding protein (TBP) (component of TFIID and TFIIIB)